MTCLFARRLCLAATLALALPLAGPAGADTRPGLFDLVTPENILRRIGQAGIGALRSLVELQYDHILPDPAAGEIAVTGIVAWPDVPWDGVGCTLTADRVILSTAEPQNWDRLRLKLDAIGLSVSPGCIAPAPRAALAKAGINMLDIAQASLEVDYQLSTAAATVTLHLDLPKLAALDGRAHFSYLAANSARGPGADAIAAYLTDANLALTDQGGLKVARQFLPDVLKTPETAGASLAAALTELIGAANGRADSAAGQDPDTTLTAEQQSFVTAAGRQFGRFLTEGGQIVVETALPESEVAIGSDFFDDPRAAFRELMPTVQPHQASDTPLIEAGLMRKVLDAAPDATDEMKLVVGTALLTGAGAPQSLAEGRAVLEPLAAAGNTEAALQLATALADSDPAAAYAQALAAAAAGESGASALLDGIEARLDTATILAAQAKLTPAAGPVSDAPFASIADLRGEALARMAGDLEPRSYPLAWFWASLAAAAGDPASASLRDEIDRKMRLHGPEAAAAWAAARAPMEKAALREWLARDLGRKFGPG